MIIVIVGGIGSGKSITAIKQILMGGMFVYTNFNLKNYKNHHRIKVTDVVDVVQNNNKQELKVNWKFWDNARKKHEHFSIFLDEAQNVIGARNFTSKINKIFNRWGSQVRKITSDHPSRNLYIMTQYPEFIDLHFRLLASIWIKCEKHIEKGEVVIINKYYSSMEALKLNKRAKIKKKFNAKPFYKYYNTLDFVTFEDAEVYV